MNDDFGERDQFVDHDWAAFPGGELEGRRPRALCEACRDRKARFRFRGVVRADRSHTLCFQCYRAELDRQRAERLPPAPLVRQARGTVILLPERDEHPKYGALSLRRRRAQIAARHALTAAELAYPAAWQPFLAASP